MTSSSKPLKLLSRVNFRKLHSHSQSKHDDNIVTAICESFRSKRNWDTVSREFASIELSNSLVERVLLELKQPADAKTALGFFHWSSKTHRFKHGLRSYCIAINVLVRAGLITDAKALLESIASRNTEIDAVRAVIDSLLNTGEFLSGSHSPVFDLLIKAYMKTRLTDVAFEACRYIEERGFCVSLTSFNALLHLAQKCNEFSTVWDVYEHMIGKRIYPNVVTLKILIDALCKEGLLQRNVDTFDRILGKRNSHSPSSIVNSSLIFKILEKGHVVEEFELVTLLKRLLQKNLIPDLVVYSLIVHVKVNLGDFDSAWEVYNEMVRRGFKENSFIYTSFIGAVCGKGQIKEAIRLMREMEGKGLKPYGETFEYVIIGCANSRRLTECLTVFDEMLSAGFVPSCLSFDKVVEKLCENGDVEKANVMLTLLLDKGFLPSDVTYSHLINGYARKDEVQEVLKLYYEMEYKSICPGLSAFVSMIRCLCRFGKLEDAEKYLRIMKGRLLTPNVDIYETLIVSHEQKGNGARVLQLRNEMTSLGS